jgi:DNA-binding XRE family transcriptional regulator
MNVYYDEDLDYLEIFFKKTPNYGDQLSDHIVEFKADSNDKVVGYGIEEASKTLNKVAFLSAPLKLAALLKIARSRAHLTQEESAHKIGKLSLRHYQRIEAGEENPTLLLLDAIVNAFPETDFSLVLKKNQKKNSP